MSECLSNTSIYEDIILIDLNRMKILLEKQSTSFPGKIPPNECPGYDTKWSDSEVPVMLELWGIPKTHS